MEYGKSSYWLIIRDLQTTRCASEDAQSMASQLYIAEGFGGWDDSGLAGGR
jgi:hypothetical protein